MNITSSVLAIALIGVAPSFAADASCKPVLDAMMKMAFTPAHLYNASSAASRGGSSASEAIYTSSGAIFVVMNGKWRRSPLTVKAMQDQQKENQQNFKGTCSHVSDEIVRGEPTALYRIHESYTDRVMDSQVWVSKSKGLPVREEVDRDTGVKGGKSHISTRFDYTNVAPPAGVQ